MSKKHKEFKAELKELRERQDELRMLLSFLDKRKNYLIESLSTQRIEEINKQIEGGDDE